MVLCSALISLGGKCLYVQSGMHEAPQVGRSIKPTVVEWHLRKLHVWILNCRCLWLAAAAVVWLIIFTESCKN